MRICLLNRIYTENGTNFVVAESGMQLRFISEAQMSKSAQIRYLYTIPR